MNPNISKLALQIKKDPSDSFSKFALALELLKEDETGKALALFLNIKNNDPEYVGVYYHLAALYVELEDPEKAIQVYKEGIVMAEHLQDQHAKSELQGALLNLEMEN